MKNIDYIKIKKEAEKMGISPFLLIKRIINYRKAKEKDPDCRFCDNLRYLGFDIKNQKKQCEVIGLSYEKHASIDNRHICNYYKKIEPIERHDYKLFIKGDKDESN